MMTKIYVSMFTIVLTTVTLRWSRERPFQDLNAPSPPEAGVFSPSPVQYLVVY